MDCMHVHWSTLPLSCDYCHGDCNCVSPVHGMMVTDAGDQHVHVFWHNLAPTNSLALVVKKTRLLSWLSFFSWSWVYIVCSASGFAHAMLFENLYLSIGKKNLFDEPPWQQLAPTRNVFCMAKTAWICQILSCDLHDGIFIFRQILIKFSDHKWNSK